MTKRQCTISVETNAGQVDIRITRKEALRMIAQEGIVHTGD